VRRMIDASVTKVERIIRSDDLLGSRRSEVLVFDGVGFVKLHSDKEHDSVEVLVSMFFKPFTSLLTLQKVIKRR
jgi:hypothetical protein